MQNLKQHVPGQCPEEFLGAGSPGKRMGVQKCFCRMLVLGEKMRDLKQHVPGQCPEEFLGAGSPGKRMGVQKFFCWMLVLGGNMRDFNIERGFT